MKRSEMINKLFLKFTRLSIPEIDEILVEIEKSGMTPPKVIYESLIPGRAAPFRRLSREWEPENDR